MSTLPDRDPQPQARAVEIVADALRVLRTRDGIEIPDALIAERARNAVTAILGDFDLVPRGQVDPRTALADYAALGAELCGVLGQLDEIDAALVASEGR